MLTAVLLSLAACQCSTPAPLRNEEGTRKSTRLKSLEMSELAITPITTAKVSTPMSPSCPYFCLIVIRCSKIVGKIITVWSCKKNLQATIAAFTRTFLLRWKKRSEVFGMSARVQALGVFTSEYGVAP